MKLDFSRGDFMRVYLLDLVRVFAISLVLVAHIGQKIGSPVGAFFGIQNFYYVSLGGVAVSIFLVLSGMVMEWNYKGLNLKLFSIYCRQDIEDLPYILSFVNYWNIRFCCKVILGL